MRQFRLFMYVLLGMLFTQIAKSQVYINEICPTNASILTNYNGDYDDWFEIYNGGAAFNLAGYGLTDDSTKPFRFTFPYGYVIPSGGKAVIFASSHTNRYIADHWEMAVNAGTSWQYKQGTSSLDTNWRNVGFDASLWSAGYGGIGFGDGDDNTTIPVGVSLMMRKTFSIPDTAQIMKAVFKMDYDDGFVAYLNGVEIARANIGTDGIRPAWNQLATVPHEAKTYRGGSLDSFFIDKSALQLALRQGTNVLAIEVHNSPENSDDMTSIPYLFFGMKSTGLTYMPIPAWWRVPVKDYFNANFKLSRDGETLYLYNPSGVIVDQKLYPVIDINNSYCRIPDGSANWCFVNTPTPNTSNNASHCYASYALAPIFSRDGGYFTGTQLITLMSPTPGGVIRYTINGNNPTTSDPVYISPITINSTTTIRARIFSSSTLPGPVVTNTYIINGHTHLSTFSITTDSLNLWDYNSGIYVLGPNADSVSPYKNANFWQDWSKPATIEYYDKSKNKIIRFDADIQIYGNYSRAKPQKSFEIKLHDSYGTKSFTYPMWPDKPYITEIDDIILRNSGTDWNKVHFRDGLMEKLMKPTFIGYLAAEPAIAYLNGQYWGVYHINENHDHHWLRDNYNLGKKEIDYLKEAGTTITTQEGSDESFWQLYNYATTENPTSPQYYSQIDKMLDLRVCADYFIAETFCNNGDWIGDWTNNIMMWRKDKEGEKWKYMLYDLDYGFGLKGDVNDNRLSMARNPAAFSYSSELFDAILKNATFKRYFINRYCDLMNTIYLSTNVDKIMRSFRDTMSYDMPEHFAKWGSSTTTWNSYINDMMTFVSQRMGISKDQIKAEFNLNGVVTLKFQANPTTAGRIEINTIVPTTLPWTGDYFNGNAITMTAIPNPGYRFDHWKSSKVITSNNPNQTLTINFNKPDVITAYFVGTATAPKIAISEINYNSNSDFNSGDWIELHNYTTVALDISGWKISDGLDNHMYVFPTGTKIAASGYLVVVEDSTKFKAQFPGITNFIGELGFNYSNGGDQIRLFKNDNSLYLSFTYQDLAPWPTLADGDGYTCEHISDAADHNNGANWRAGCFGGSPGRAYTTALAFTPSVTGSTTFCSGSSTQLIANSFTSIASTYQWKKNGTSISGATDSVYAVSASGTYTVTISNNGCSGGSNGQVMTAVSQQPLPVTAGANRCSDGPVTLSATGTDSVFWYNSPQGTMIGSGNTLSIANLSQTTTYYAVNGRNCPSNPVATVAQIIPLTATPVVVDTFRCGPGAITLSASDTAVIRWYNSPSGGGLLATGNTFTTGIVENDTMFFVEAGTTCPSLRTEIDLMVTSTTAPVVSDGGRCGNGQVTLYANSNLPVFWYDNANGGNQLGTGNTFLTPPIAQTDTFYAEANTGCPSPRVMAIAMINPVPAAPVAHDSVSCMHASFQITADADEQLNWYTTPSGGNRIYTGMLYQTPVLTQSTTYYVSNGYTCESNRVPLNVILPSTPAAPVSSDQSRCDDGSVTFTATSGAPISWYDSPSGGNVLATGSTFTTPVLSNTTPYYVESGDTCRSFRVVVNAIVNPTGTIAAGDVSRCGDGTVTLNATSNLPSNSILWYSYPAGGNVIGTGSAYLTAPLTSGKTYYVEAGLVCKSARIPVNVSIIHTGTVSSNDVSRCDNGTVILTANSTLATDSIFWYDSATGNNIVATGNTYTTPNLSGNSTFYTESGAAGCRSPRIPVNVIINQTSSVSTVSGYGCGSGNIFLSAASNAPADSVFWYDAIGGNVVGTGNSFVTPLIQSSTTYYVQAHAICAGAPVAANAVIFASPAVDIGIDTAYIESGESLLLDGGGGFNNYSWSTGETTQQITVSNPGYYSVVITDVNGCNGSDQVLVILTTSTGKINSNSFVGLYPNPAHDFISVRLKDLPSHVSISLITTDGKTVYKEDLKSVHGTLNKTMSLSGISSGVYFVQVEGENYSRKEKVLVEK
jgi:hypothetical protein